MMHNEISNRNLFDIVFVAICLQLIVKAKHWRYFRSDLIEFLLHLNMGNLFNSSKQIKCISIKIR